MTMGFYSQTDTTLNDRVAQHLRRNPHVLSDKKMTYSIVT